MWSGRWQWLGFRVSREFENERGESYSMRDNTERN